MDLIQSKTGVDTAIAIGLVVAIRPTFLFWPAFLLIRGDRRPALKSALVTATASVLPVFLYGPRIYRQWLAAFQDVMHWRSPANISIAAFFHRLGPLVGVGLASGIALLLA